MCVFFLLWNLYFLKFGLKMKFCFYFVWQAMVFLGSHYLKSVIEKSVFLSVSLYPTVFQYFNLSIYLMTFWYLFANKQRHPLILASVTLRIESLRDRKQAPLRRPYFLHASFNFIFHVCPSIFVSQFVRCFSLILIFHQHRQPTTHHHHHLIFILLRKIIPRKKSWQGCGVPSNKQTKTKSTQNWIF